MLTDLFPLLPVLYRASAWVSDKAIEWENFVRSWCDLFGVDVEC